MSEEKYYRICNPGGDTIISEQSLIIKGKIVSPKPKLTIKKYVIE